MVLISYSHISLRDRYPDTDREVAVVPRVGESVTVCGQNFEVYGVHWWENTEPGQPLARVSLRTAAEMRQIRSRAG